MDKAEEGTGHSNAYIVDKRWARGVQMISESNDQGRDLVWTGWKLPTEKSKLRNKCLRDGVLVENNCVIAGMGEYNPHFSESLTTT